MGSFYTSIHFLTNNPQGVEEAWTRLWQSRGEQSWAWLTPAYGGWVSLFDWQCDQPNTDMLKSLASAISSESKTVAVAFQVFDSALAEYWLYRQGKEVDHYTSNDDYFAAFAERSTPSEGIYDGYGPDESENIIGERDVSDGGSIPLLRSLTGTRVDEVALEAILRTPAPIADDILTALASAIGINDIWAGLGYHYLVNEGETVVGFEQFRHLPTGNPPMMQQRDIER